MGFPSTEKFADEKNTRKALAYKDFGNFINRLSERLAELPHPALGQDIRPLSTEGHTQLDKP